MPAAHHDTSSPSELEWAPSVLTLPLAETPLRPWVHLGRDPGAVTIDLVLDLPDPTVPVTWRDTPRRVWSSCTGWWRGVLR